MRSDYTPNCKSANNLNDAPATEASPAARASIVFLQRTKGYCPNRRVSPQTLVIALLAVTLICALKLANCSAGRKHRAGFSGIDRTKSEGEKGADLLHQRANRRRNRHQNHRQRSRRSPQPDTQPHHHSVRSGRHRRHQLRYKACSIDISTDGPYARKQGLSPCSEQNSAAAFNDFVNSN